MKQKEDKPKTVAEIMKENSITSLGKLTRTKVEYGFTYVYFDGSTKPIRYCDGKEILAKRLVKQ